MTLKEIIAGDVQGLFFALDDFGETHEIEGKSIDIVIDNDELRERKRELGDVEGDILFYGRTEELPKGKAPGSFINMDGREYILLEKTDNMGVTSMVLKQNRTF